MALLAIEDATLFDRFGHTPLPGGRAFFDMKPLVLLLGQAVH